jgi:hypothetical protein
VRLMTLLLLCGCAQVTSLNLRRHQFGMQPTKIIWFQIAGLDAEHLALVRFGLPTVDNKTELENSLCLGRAWSFNLQKLRPSAGESFVSQVTGKKDVAGTCEDWGLKPIWNYLSPFGYKNGIVEVGASPKESWGSGSACGDSWREFLGKSTLWMMGAAGTQDSIPYLPSEAQAYDQGKVYWDRSCNALGCGTSLSSVLASLYPSFAKSSQRHVFIVRDFTFAAALATKKVSQAREILRELDKSIGVFMRATSNSDDILVLVSGGAAIDLDFPAEGTQWQQFERSDKNIYPRQGELSVPVFAHGARAENFCGLYEESQIFERILSSPKQQGLELKVINPFN